MWVLSFFLIILYNFFPTQEEVHKYVQMMGGRVYRDLNVSVTHLIAGEVGSKKYLVAASLKKPILLPSWVKALWDKSQKRYEKNRNKTDFVLGTGNSYGDTDFFFFFP